MTTRTLLGFGLVAVLATLLLRFLASAPRGCVPGCPQCGGRGMVLTPDDELPARPCPGPGR